MFQFCDFNRILGLLEEVDLGQLEATMQQQSCPKQQDKAGRSSRVRFSNRFKS